MVPPLKVADPKVELKAPPSEPSAPVAAPAAKIPYGKFVKTGSIQQVIDLGNGLKFQFTQKVDQNGDAHSAVEEEIFDKDIATALRALKGRYGVFDITP